MTAFSRAAQLQRLLGQIDRLIARGARASSAYTKWRLAIFLTGLVCTVTLYKTAWYQTGNLALGGFVALFVLVASNHSRLEQRIHRLRLWHTLKSVHLARIRLDWSAVPLPPGSRPESHAYANDLDLTGPHSLLHLIDTTVSDHGRDRLTSWLLTQPPSEAQWEARRRLVQELTPRSLFRDRLLLASRLTGEQEINGRRLAAVLAHPVGFPRLSLILAIQATLAVMTLFLGVGALLGWLPGYWMFTFGAYAVIYLMTDQGEELLEHAVGLHGEMERLGVVLGYLERHARGRRSALGDACAPLMHGRRGPSASVKRAARALHGVSVKAHPLIHLAVNAFCPWDLWFTRQLRGIQEDIARQLPVWLDRLAEVEAASALATFAFLHPTYVWPSRTADTAVRASSLAHPLIPAGHRVANDLELAGLGSIHLITGSNMSGKSTFLRTIGINLCLAQAGAPVCAERLDWSPVRLACCIRVDDSLDAGLSFFYAEVKRLKTILDAIRDDTAPPVLFLIDEIFKGTNNRERLIGSRAYITALSTGNGFGLVSTHDLELTDLEKDIASLINAHFQETVTGGALSFDYILRPGPCPTTNALKIMEMEGLPVHQEEPDRRL
ncbi:putative DNA mismatch repair protein, MutS family [Nitrospira japonica]|uniref:Putative DNA mismatch repair protein, MutS family n=1 Tax=Nitrospira japonica TaxID=1325564 RepID=A0A1W1I5P8_9BACT|nr:MutS family DNA mismatch repair protein [Nitrospira japonica]SLM48336.1 putative DNA mismatch repair protein, MutS family [Nitrospira japonica]